MQYDPDNKLFHLALALVNQSSRNLFLTGKAGTGKTTFLKYIRENSLKQMAVVAPTGVAAINAGGVTIHSFFQLPFAPFIPDTGAGFSEATETVSRHSLLSRLRFTKDKLDVLRQLELLVIDEVSMVRSDTIDAIDAVLRHARKKPYERFGGVQVLFIGDLYQLPPVIRDPEWQLLSPWYASPYFFDSQAIREEPPVYVEFDKIYRQRDESFIRVLNQVRNNELDAGGMQLLESRFQPGFSRQRQEGYIILTTHNERARDINTRELEQLDAARFTYRAVVKDEFPGSAYPADEVLYLNEGAQVMFIKNDSDRSKRYYNGKIGVVTRLDKEAIQVQCPGDPDAIDVTPETWENIRYTLNKSSRSMEAEPLGSFSQYPLRLAWAITIHKSQGLTFEKAIIDAGQAFAAGQVYVALSRCTSLEGMVLESRVQPGSLRTDERITGFLQRCILPGQLKDELAEARKHYLEKLLRITFDFTTAIQECNDLRDYLQEHSSSFNPESAAWCSQLLEKLEQLQSTAVKFHSWLRSQFSLPVLAEENMPLQNRVRNGAIHFNQEITLLLGHLHQCPAVTDSRLHAKEFNESARELFAELSLKSFLLQAADGLMDTDAWHKRKRSFVLPAFSINAYSGSQQSVQSAHPALYQQLKKLRDDICAKKNSPVYIVAGSKTLEEMVLRLPRTPEELEQVKGFGPVKVEKYGRQFLDIIVAYCDEHGLEPVEPAITEKRSRKEKPLGRAKPDTKAESFRLFREGKTIDDIAALRQLHVQTIEGHLAHYVRRGEIGIEELVSREKIILIEPALKELGGDSLSPLKQKLGSGIGFGEIKLVLAWSAYRDAQQNDAAAGSSYGQQEE